MKKRYLKYPKENGQVLALVLVVVSLVLVNTLVIVGGSLLFYQNSTYLVEAAQATNLAEAGADKALASLNASPTSYSGESETFLGPGSYSVNLTAVDNNTKIIESTGYIPSKENPKVKRTVKINASRGIGAAFDYGLQSGDGGLEMSQNSQVIGSVYANGDIQMENNAQITGDAFVAGGTQPTADEQSDCTSPNCVDFEFGTNVGGQAILDVAQSFKPSSSAVLNKVSLKLKKVGSPSDVTVYLLADNNGMPDKSNVLASGTLYASLVTTSYSFVDAAFSSPPSLTSGATYWIMIAVPSVGSSNYWYWSQDSLQGYTQGSALWSSNWQAKSPTWNSISGDLGFKTFTSGVATSISGENGAAIGGNAHANALQNLTVSGSAYYQVIQNVTAAKLYPNSPDPAMSAMPLSEGNIQDWKNLAETAGVYSGDITTCPPTLPSGKYEGSISLPGNCSVTINSPVWITGNLSLSNSDTLKLNPSFGPSSGVVIVDNFIGINNGNALSGSGTSGSYLILISEFDSKDDPQNRDAITLSNGGNTGIVYSNLGSIRVSNNNNLTQITGWKLKLDNNVTVTYDQGLSSAFFSSGPSGSFSLVKGTYQLR